MVCEDMKLKIQALIDNELDEREISEVLDHISSCYQCRDEYIAFLKLQKKMKGEQIPEPSREWFEQLAGKRMRKAGSVFGKVLFFGSYIVLLGYGLSQLFQAPEEGLFLKLLVGTIFGGLLILFGITVGDRIQESKTDTYKGVMK